MGLESTPLLQRPAGPSSAAASPLLPSFPGLPHALSGHHEHAHGHLRAEQLPAQPVDGSQAGQAEDRAPHTSRAEVPEETGQWSRGESALGTAPKGMLRVRSLGYLLGLRLPS